MHCIFFVYWVRCRDMVFYVDFRNRWLRVLRREARAGACEGEGDENTLFCHERVFVEGGGRGKGVGRVLL